MDHIRNVKGTSGYFMGGYRVYHKDGGFQWDVKLHHIDLEHEYELEMLRDTFLGYYGKYDNKYGFEHINDLLGRKVDASLAGRSGGWLVIDENLSETEVEKIDNLVTDIMNHSQAVLNEYRREAEEERQAELAELNNKRDEIASLDNVKKAVKLLKAISSDIKLTINGIELDGIN